MPGNLGPYWVVGVLEPAKLAILYPSPTTHALLIGGWNSATFCRSQCRLFGVVAEAYAAAVPEKVSSLGL